MRIVLKMGGNVCKDPAQVAAVAAEIKTLQEAGHEVAVVHGGGPQLDTAIQALGEPVHKIDGLRVTSDTAAGVVERVMDAIGADLAAQLNFAGLVAHHIGVAGESFDATVKDPRLGRVGTVTAFSPEDGLGFGVAVITPVGHDFTGPLNVNADEGAAAVAAWWKADWLVLATDVAAVRGAAGESLGRLTTGQAQLLIGGPATGGMIPKLGNAIQAVKAGVGRVLIGRIAPGVVTGAILEGNVEGTLITEANT